MGSRKRVPIRELTVFAVFSAIMVSTRFLMQQIPGVHFLGLIIATFTLVYRTRALVLIYLYVMLEGLLSGFAMWMLPYFYVWIPLWGSFMLAGKLKFPVKIKVPLFCVLCGLHGLSFGTLYAPFQAVLFGISFKGILAWIIAGLPYDIIHGISNAYMGILIVPMSELLRKLNYKGY